MIHHHLSLQNIHLLSTIKYWLEINVLKRIIEQNFIM